MLGLQRRALKEITSISKPFHELRRSCFFSSSSRRSTNALIILAVGSSLQSRIMRCEGCVFSGQVLPWYRRLQSPWHIRKTVQKRYTTIKETRHPNCFTSIVRLLKAISCKSSKIRKVASYLIAYIGFLEGWGFC